MAPALTLGGLSLTTGPFDVAYDGIDFGTADLMATILAAGDLRPEEIDQYLEELQYVRGIVVPLRIGGGTPAAVVANAQQVIQKLSTVNRFNPSTLTFKPTGGNVSTFTVLGGSLVILHDGLTEASGIQPNAELHIAADPFCLGATQTGGALGSSGSPLITNAASPANVTLSPSPAGDVPGEVTLFVKNRSASAIRSLIAACIGGNTTWVETSNASGWTLDAKGDLNSGVVSNFAALPVPADTVLPIAHFTAPTLPSDRPFRLYLRAAQSISVPDYIKFRVRLVSGANEIVGPWVAIPQENFTATTPFSTSSGFCLVDMGIYYLPVGEVGLLGAQSTTIYIESFTHNTSNVAGFQQAVFLPNASALIAETQDTSKTLAAASGIVRVESDSIFDNSGNPAGGTVTGAHIRSLGGRYVIYTSQYSINTLDKTQPFLGENVDAWFTYQPRFLHLA